MAWQVAGNRMGHLYGAGRKVSRYVHYSLWTRRPCRWSRRSATSVVERRRSTSMVERGRRRQFLLCPERRRIIGDEAFAISWSFSFTFRGVTSLSARHGLLRHGDRPPLDPPLLRELLHHGIDDLRKSRVDGRVGANHPHHLVALERFILHKDLGTSLIPERLDASPSRANEPSCHDAWQGRAQDKLAWLLAHQSLGLLGPDPTARPFRLRGGNIYYRRDDGLQDLQDLVDRLRADHKNSKAGLRVVFITPAQQEFRTRLLFNGLLRLPLDTK
mmetsp:Transcript_29629/g.64456  ORF Transcript_29629/g.64456 Transcript_29629/m.64456 type:complete len:273 (-) Transcript_29629:198-1016(-)